jgi:hypothetical protein
MQELNIVELIEKNPISKLSKAYNNKLINKIKENFNGFEQQLFVSSFYCYLNYDKNIDFVVDLDDIWKWLGFSTKQKSEFLLEKHFKIDVDYTNLTHQLGESSLTKEKLLNLKDKQDSTKNIKQNGGQNKKIILLTIKCFKSLCLKAQTNKASEIHEYYMKMEEVLHQIVEEETDELRLQLEEKENIILEIKQHSDQEKEQLLKNSKKEKQKAVEQTILVHFPLNTECIYIGTIDNTNDANEKLIKFGHTNDLATRINDHRKGYENFVLVEAFKVQNKVEIENLIKTYPKIKRQIRSIQLNGKNKTELIAYDATNFTIDVLTKHIKDIIHSKTYSIDNFNRIMKLNEDLENKIRELEEQNKKLEIENRELENENKKIKEQPNIITNEPQIVFTPKTDSELDKKFNEFITSSCIVRSDVEEYSVNMEGRYRLWSQVKPTKEVFHAFKNYLDIRFKPKRIEANHGYSGIKLKPIEYKKTKENSNVETFIFQVCQFSDCGKVLNSVLLSEYQKWKVSVGKELSENDMKEIKEYLNESSYALKAVVWTNEGNNEGYYGLSIKKHEYTPKLICSTGKKVYKREDKTDILLATWDTIAKAATAEGVSTAKMSRHVKNKIIINDYYYSVI